MKKATLCLLVCLLLFAGAHAQTNVMLEHGDRFFGTNPVGVGDTLYMLAETDGGEMTIASWRFGQEQMETAKESVDFAYYVYIPDMADSDGRVITRLFTDGQRLMSFDPAKGVVYEILMNDGMIDYWNIVPVSDPEALYAEGTTMSVIRAEARNNMLYWLSSVWSADGYLETLLHSVDLNNGYVEQLPVRDAVDFAVTSDGKVMVLRAYDGLAVLDPVTGMMQPHSAQPLGEIYNIMYSQAENALIYLENQRVMGFDELTELTQFAYIPLEPIDAAVLGNTVVVTDGSVTIIRDLVPGYEPEHVLTVMGNAYRQQDTVRRFVMDNPDTAVYWYEDFSGYMFDQSYESLSMLMKEDQLDVAVVALNTSGFGELLAAGLCADLSEYEALADEFATLYPAYLAPVTKDGRYYAMPVEASSWGWYYDPYVLESTDLMPEELPTNLIDLCAFITRWNNELMDEYPGIALFSYVEDMRSHLLGAILEMYAPWCEHHYGVLEFDTPEFRELIAALEGMQCDRIDRAAAESYVWSDGLFGNDFAAIGWFEWAEARESGEAVWLPMALNDSTERIEPVRMGVAFVNALSDDKAKAAELMAALLKEQSDESVNTLFATGNDAVAEPEYDLFVQQAEEYLQLLCAERAAAGDHAWEINELIAFQQRYMEEELPKLKWRITVEDMTFYRQEMAPFAVAVGNNFISNWTSEKNIGYYELLEAYSHEKITTERLILELNALR